MSSGTPAENRERTGAAQGGLGRRAVVAAVGIPLALAAGWLGGWVLGVVLGALAAVGTLEYGRLGARVGVNTFALPAAWTAAALVLIATANPALEHAAPLQWLLLLVLLLASAAAAVRFRGVEGRPLEAVALTLAGPLYTGGTLSFALFLRHLGGGGAGRGGTGFALLIFPVLITWANDSAAFFVGRARGRRRIAPQVSPGKTAEGAAAGLVAGAAAGGILAAVLRGGLALPIGVAAAIVSGLLLAVVGQLGDLAKSVLKREAGVKDSGTLFPGHGGVLDRLDSLFFALPTFYLLLRFLLF